MARTPRTVSRRPAQFGRGGSRDSVCGPRCDEPLDVGSPCPGRGVACRLRSCGDNGLLHARLFVAEAASRSSRGRPFSQRSSQEMRRCGEQVSPVPLRSKLKNLVRFIERSRLRQSCRYRWRQDMKRGPRKIAIVDNRGHFWGEQHRIKTGTKRNHSRENWGHLTSGDNFSRCPRRRSTSMNAWPRPIDRDAAQKRTFTAMHGE